LLLLLYVLLYASSALFAVQYLFLSEILLYRSQATPDHILFTLYNNKVIMLYIVHIVRSYYEYWTAARAECLCILCITPVIGSLLLTNVLQLGFRRLVCPSCPNGDCMYMNISFECFFYFFLDMSTSTEEVKLCVAFSDRIGMY
jgi:hypothetical protein